MYCPKCGSEAANDSKYCRLCGMNLLPVSILIEGQELVVNAHKRISNQNSSAEARQANSKRMMQNGIALLIIGLVCTIVFGVLNIDKLAGLVSAVMIAGAGLIAYPWLPGIMNKELHKSAVTSADLNKSFPAVGQNQRFNTSEMPAVGNNSESTTWQLKQQYTPEKLSMPRPQAE